MKLELKHLVPYLPYEIGIQYGSLATQYLRADTLHLIDLCINSSWKPILRPLSDLSRYNDEVIINEHYINSVLTEKEYGNEYGILSYFKGEVNIELEGDPELRYDARKAISFKSIQKITELLYEGHFDVFGLIEKGLAIDKNKLNK